MTAHAELAPSAAARWLTCHASVTASRGVETVSSVYADEGTEAHRQLHLWLELGVPPADGQLYEELEHAYSLVLALEEQGYTVYFEQRVAYGKNVWGTADIIGVPPSKRKPLVIADYKHGYVVVEAERNAQMATYAVCAREKFGSFNEYKLIVVQPRVNHKDGAVRTWACDDDWIDWHRGEIDYAVKAIYGDDPQFAPGDKHCRYCPLEGECRAYANYVANKITGEDLL